MKRGKLTIERHFDYASMTITGYRLLGPGRVGEWSPVAREWAEDQVCRGKASYIDVGRLGPITTSRATVSTPLEDQTMTEDQIERHVERKYDALDARLMSGALSQAEYDFQHKCIARWAEDQYLVVTPAREG